MIEKINFNRESINKRANRGMLLDRNEKEVDVLARDPGERSN